jgi:predicted ATPase
MAILEGIQIKNFRALKNVTLGKVTASKGRPLSRLSAVIGANGAGKSTLLDAFEFVSDCLVLGVERACHKGTRGGFDKLRSVGSSEPIEFQLRYKVTPEAKAINYSFKIDAPAGVAEVISETLWHRTSDDGQPHVDKILHLERGQGRAEKNPVHLTDRQSLAITALSAFSNYPQVTQFKSYLSHWYLSFFTPDASRERAVGDNEPHLSRSGGNLTNYLRFIQSQSEPRFNDLLANLSKKIPNLERIDSRKAEDGHLILRFYMKGLGDTPLYAPAMSDGTLKLLAYFLLMEDPEPFSLIGIEEPENGLYPDLLGALMHAFKKCASRSNGPQIFLTTHSMSLLDALAPSEVWVLQKGVDGFSTLQCTADIRDVQSLYEQDFTLGNLWYSNHFGVRVQ